MTSNRQKAFLEKNANLDKEFTADDAFIARIVYVQNPVIRTLVAHFHDYCSFNEGDIMELDEAKRRWRQNPRNITRNDKDSASEDNDFSGVYEEEMPDVDSYISEVMMQESEDFNADMQDWYERHKLALRVRATAIVAYNNGTEYARVIGDWCTLSRCVKLRVHGQIEGVDTDGGGQMNIVDTTRRGHKHGIDMVQSDRLSGGDFYTLLLERGGMHENECMTHLRKFFTVPSASLNNASAAAVNGVDDDNNGADTQSYLNPIVVSRKAFRNAAVARGSTNRLPVLDEAKVDQFNQVRKERAQANEKAMLNVLTVRELRDRIVASKLDLQKFFGTEFVSLALRLILLGEELAEIREMYGTREVQLDAAARGVQFIRAISELARGKTHILCFSHLRRAYGEAHRVRQLGLLPDISQEAYENLCRKWHVGEPDPVKCCAVALYIDIFRCDVYGDSTERRREDSYPVGNMCTVLGMHENDRTARYYHGRADRANETPDDEAELADVNSMSYSGRFCMPASVNITPAKEIDFDEEPPAVSVDFETRQLLRSDVARLKRGRFTTDDFVSALAWMLRMGIVVRERFAGTGPHNRGLAVDAFFLAAIYDTQRRFEAVIVDVYERALKQSLLKPVTELSNAMLISIYEELQALRADWRRDYIVLMKMQHQQQQRAETERRSDVPVAVNYSAAHRTYATAPSHVEMVEHASAGARAATDTAPSGPSPITNLARAIAAREKMMYDLYSKLDLGYDDKNDAYKDVRKDKWLSRMSLLTRCRPPMLLADGRPFAVEQIAALQRITLCPISQVVGPAGTGKTELIQHICNTYAHSQIQCVALTGKVAADMQNRTRLDAKTVHAVLFGHMRLLEALYKARSYRDHANQKRRAAGGKAGEQFTHADVMACDDEKELRAYVESRLDSYPPVTSVLEGKRVLIIDETSLLDMGLVTRLLEAAHDPKNGFYLERIIFCGDPGQLTPVGYGNVLSDLLHGNPGGVSRLTQNHRVRGRGLFDLSKAMADHALCLPMPKFALSEAVEQLRLESGPEIVCLQTSSVSLVENLKIVVSELGAIDDERKREKIQIIATTRAEVEAANDTVRWLYFGSRALALAKNQRSGRVFSKDATVESLNEDERAYLMNQLRMRIMVGDRIYLKRNVTIFFKPHNGEEEGRKRGLYNSRILYYKQRYNAPKKMAATLFCRCGLCPPPLMLAGSEKGKPPKGQCMQRLDEVPWLRRGVANENDSVHKFDYHNHKMPNWRERTRAMAVFLEETGDWLELDIGQRLNNRSMYDFGHALTTHRMQGAQQETIIYICTEPRAYINCKNLYTALTRARSRVIILSSDSTFDQVNRRRAPPRRSTLAFHLFDKIRMVLNRHPLAPFARQTLHLYHPPNDDAVVEAAARWQVFETLRLNSDREAVSAHAVGGASMQHDNDDDEELEELEEGEMCSDGEDSAREDSATKRRRVQYEMEQLFDLE